MKDYLSGSPVFSDRVNLLEETDTDHADNFNIATKQLFDNIMCLKNAICKEMQSQTLAAGETSVTFTMEKIEEDSRINVYTSVPDVEYTNITVSGNNITVEFEAQETDVYVKVVVSDALV